MMKLIFGQSLAARPTSRTSEYASRCGNCASPTAGRALVNADLVVAHLEQLLVERVDELVVVHAPRMLADVLVGVVADRVALERVRLEVTNGVIDLLHPARVARREDGVAQHAARARLAVHA